MYPEWNSSIDHSFPYFTGNGMSTYCRYVLNYDKFRENKHCNNKNWYFVKTDYIEKFFLKHYPNKKFILFTHNSDYPIDSKYSKYINDSNLIFWFAQNLDIEHPKLKPLPIGIANYGYPHGNISSVTKVREKENIKTKLFYANYTLGNNNAERSYCLKQTGISLEVFKNEGSDFAGGYKVAASYEEYLDDMSKCYFVISPKGNGIDCHRTWEALYVKSIPIVTRSLVVDGHKDYPIIILNDWSEFKNIKFSSELYEKIWNNFNVGDIHMDNYLKRIRNIIGV